ncbi:hypothetical protein [Streptomyces sp. NPDC055099]
MPRLSCRWTREGCRLYRSVAPRVVGGDITRPPDPARGVVRYGHMRGTDTDIDTDAAPVPQYGLNRAG